MIGAARRWMRRRFPELAGPGIERIDARALAALRNRHRGRRVWVIGNGPSLNQTDLSKLRGEITIGSNGIFLLFDRIGFKPTFYTVEDTLVAEDRAGVINALRGTTKVFPADLRYCLSRDPDTVFVNFIRPGYANFPRFSDRFEKLAYWGGTVTYLNLQLALHVGASEICLVGVDHSYQVHTAQDRKEGSVITSGTADANHFHPDYFGPGFRYHDPRVDRMEQGYVEAKRFLDSKGCRVVNATAGGRLEVFPRIRYEELFP